MRFIDASVFVHAYLKPKRVLTADEIQIKKDAKSIVNRLNDGELGVVSVVHFSEIANILEDHMSRKEALEIERGLYLRDTIEIQSVERKDCFEALLYAEERNIGFSDALAYVSMKKREISEIYSFDHDFDLIPEIKRVRK